MGRRRLTGADESNLPGLCCTESTPNRAFENSARFWCFALSRFENSGGTTGNGPTSPSASDQDFGIGALDYAKPNRYFGPSVLDRSHQISFGGYA